MIKESFCNQKRRRRICPPTTTEAQSKSSSRLKCASERGSGATRELPHKKFSTSFKKNSRKGDQVVLADTVKTERLVEGAPKDVKVSSKQKKKRTLNLDEVMILDIKVGLKLEEKRNMEFDEVMIPNIKTNHNLEREGLRNFIEIGLS